MFKSFSMLAVAACAGMSIVSCTAEKDLYNPEVVEQNVKADYAANFVKKYGAIAADQSWDFSTGPISQLPSKSTRGTGDEAESIPFNPQVTHGVHADGSTGTDGYYYVDSSSLDYLNTNLIEQHSENFDKGTSFTLNMPGNKFTIMPIYVGYATLTWSLHLVVQNPNNPNETKDLTIWTKGTDVEVSDDGRNWTLLSATDANNKLSDSRNKAHVRTKPNTISGVTPGSTMYFYLDVSNGTQMSSLHHQMIALEDMAAPNNLPEYKNKEGVTEKRKVMIIGCEDLDVDKYPSVGDRDMNDVVFMIYGDPDIPEQQRVVDEEQVISKRYMIEDLGSTDDFDFNDIVVDVTAKRTVKHLYVGDKPVKENYEIGEWRDETATLRHLGGILPFTVKIGNTDITSWEPNIDENGVVRGDAEGEVVSVTGWDPDKNNITVMVSDQANDGTKPVSIDFPKAGAVPMIIATDTDTMWSNERVSLPKMW